MASSSRLTIIGSLGGVWSAPPKNLPKPTNLFAAQGLRFERNVVKGLTALRVNGAFGPTISHNPTFAYSDARGEAICVPDIVIKAEDLILCLEVKLTYNKEGVAKLKGLYLPILSHYHNLPAYGILVAKALTREVNDSDIINCLSQVVSKPHGSVSTLHYLGQGPISWN